MRLSRIYLETDITLQHRVELPTAAAHYIKNVLRLKEGQQITIFNGMDSREFTARIEFVRKTVTATPLTITENNLESPIHSSIIQALGKPEHIDFIVQKSTEMGVNRICLFNSERTQHHLKAERLQKKLDHWKSIMISACEQCGRNMLPEIEFVTELESALQSNTDSDRIVLDFAGAGFDQISSDFSNAKSFAMLIGAEGGLSETEISQARQAGFIPCRMGPRVLRMETAAIAILALVQHQFGDMN